MHTYDDKIIIPSLNNQMGLMFGAEFALPEPGAGVYFSAPSIDMSIYDRVVLCFSAGKIVSPACCT